MKRKPRRRPTHSARQLSASARLTRHKRWVRKVRAAALQRARMAEQSALSFDQLSREQKWLIVCDLVATRSGDLLRAYPDAVDIVAGYRRVRQAPRGTTIVPDPRVKVLVKQKWPPNRPGPERRRIPERL